MEVILLQKVANLGNIGDKVKVKPGYGRNFLLPQGKATVATAANLAAFEARRAEIEALAAGELESSKARAAKLEGYKLAISAKAGSEGKLFGSVGPRDIAEAFTAAGLTLDKGEVVQGEGPIRHVGEFEVRVHLHADIESMVKVIVVPES